MHSYISQLEKEFRKNGNPADAVQMKQYMRNQFKFFGLKSEGRNIIINDYMRHVPLPQDKSLRLIIKELWTLPEREFQYLGIALLVKCKTQWNEKDILLFEKLIINKSWWDTVDHLAGHVTGPWFKKYPEYIPAVTKRWNRSDNFWLQRMSLLFQLKYKKDTDVTLMFDYIKNLSTSKEFFVQKAIGWILREYSKTDQKAVVKFLKTNEVMPLSRREAMKIIDKSDK